MTNPTTTQKRETFEAQLDAMAAFVVSEKPDSLWAHHLRDHGRNNGHGACERCANGE